MAFFALTLVAGPDWNDALPRRDQRGWNEHAAFMDGLVEDGFVILGGPIGDGAQALLAVEAPDETEVRARLGDDPWAAMEMLRIGVIKPWTVWLDGRRGKRPRRIG